MTGDICRICGKEGPLSFEHIPPQSVGNNHTVKLYSGVDAVKSSLTGQDDMEVSAIAKRPRIQDDLQLMQ